MRRLLVAIPLVLFAAPVVAGVPVGWRGDGSGHYPDATPPTSWTPDTHVAWSTEMPDWGNGSPIVVGDRVFVTAEPTWLICVRRSDGAVLWKAENRILDAVSGVERGRVQTEVERGRRLGAELDLARRELSRAKRAARKHRGSKSPGEVRAQLDALSTKVNALKDAHDETRRYRTPPTGDMIGYGSSTPLSDGKHVYAVFGNGVVSAFTLGGERVWSRWLRDSPKLAPGFWMHGHLEGHSASPRLIGDVLVVGFGHLYGLNATTGRELWRAGEFRHYGTPAVIPGSSGPSVALSDGRLIRGSDGTAAAGTGTLVLYSSPVSQGRQLVFAGATNDDAGAPASVAILWDASGSGKAVWRHPLDEARYHASPLVDAGLVYTLSVRGELMVLDIADGTLIYRKRLPLDKAQPSISRAGDYLYLHDDRGTTVVLTPGRRYDLVAQNRLTPFRATPFFVGREMYVRAHERLYRIEE